MPHGNGALVLLTSGRTRAAGARTFALERESVAAGRNVSFLGNIEQMKQVAEQSTPSFVAWKNFGGLAFHGLLE